MRSLILTCAIAAPLTVLAAPKKECVHWDENMEQRLGYCQALRVGRTIYVSGTTSTQSGMEAQVRDIYEKLHLVLKQLGATSAHVVSERAYTLDLEALKTASTESRSAFYKGNLPAATWVEVKRLWEPRFLVEIELVVELP